MKMETFDKFSCYKEHKTKIETFEKIMSRQTVYKYDVHNAA